MNSQEITDQMIKLSNERDKVVADYRKQLLELEKKRVNALKDEPNQPKEGDK